MLWRRRSPTACTGWWQQVRPDMTQACTGRFKACVVVCPHQGWAASGMCARAASSRW